MNKKIKVGKIAGLEITFKPSAILSFFTVAGVLITMGMALFKLKPKQAIAGGLIAAILHWVSGFWHQFGHARAAELANYPMAGIQFQGPLGFSKYPPNEGMIPAEIHMQRAMGGPVFSFLLALVAGVMMLILRPLGGAAAFASFFLFADNLLVFTIGALLPLGFNDGSTLLKYWPQRQKGKRIVVS